MLFFHSYKKLELRMDILEDIRLLNKEAMRAKESGAIILEGGLVKHHILNANMMRNGLDRVVFVNTGLEYDASDAGASPTEALSWGKIQENGKYSKIFGEASILFPL